MGGQKKPWTFHSGRRWPLWCELWQDKSSSTPSFINEFGPCKLRLKKAASLGRAYYAIQPTKLSMLRNSVHELSESTTHPHKACGIRNLAQIHYTSLMPLDSVSGLTLSKTWQGVEYSQIPLAASSFFSISLAWLSSFLDSSTIETKDLEEVATELRLLRRPWRLQIFLGLNFSSVFTGGILLSVTVTSNKSHKENTSIHCYSSSNTDT